MFIILLLKSSERNLNMFLLWHQYFGKSVSGKTHSETTELFLIIAPNFNENSTT